MVIKSNSTSLFAQEYPGAEPVYLGDIDEDCFNLDSIPNPKGSVDPINCIDGMGNLKIIGIKRGARDLVSFSMENLLDSAAHYLEELLENNCPWVFHALQRCDGKAGIFSNWLRAESVSGMYFTDDQFGNVRQRDATDEMTRGFDVTGTSPRYDAWVITASQKLTSEAEDANTIHSYVIENCGGECGAQAKKCEIIGVGCDCDTGVATANVLFSTDGGNTWAAAAQDPYASNTVNVIALRMFQVGASTVRTLVVRSTLAATPLQAAYTDDRGATAWTTAVNIGSTNAEAVLRHDGLFVLDENNIWVCTDAGNVYKSTNGGVTWTVQSSAVTASGGADLYAIKFLDANFGVATGAADLVIYTLDGGKNWVTGTGTGGGGELWTLAVFSRYRWIVGTDDGEIWQTQNGGTTWTEMTQFTGTGTGDIEGIAFLNELDGYAAHTDGGAVGRVLRTIDGGYSWIRVDGTAFASAGFKAVYPCSVNHVFAVGDDDGTRAIIAEAG